MVTNFFLGANSSAGFRSLYEDFTDPNKNYDILVLKGGPGVGKSSFMKYIGSRAEDWPHPGLERLGALGFSTAAMALSPTALSIEDPRLREVARLAIVLGTEGDGLSPRTIAGCDYTVRIPMSHQVDSLNVAAASTVAFWELRAR